MRPLTKNILIFSLLIFVFVPVLVGAADPKPIIPDCGTTQAGGGVNRECGYADLLTLVNNVINWIIMISVPVAAGVFAWAGIIYMTTGIADKKSDAKRMLWKVFFGFVFILAAWIIVTTITNALLRNPSIVPIQGASQ